MDSRVYNTNLHTREDLDPIDSLPYYKDAVRIMKYNMRHTIREQLEQAAIDASRKFQTECLAHLTFPLTAYDLQLISTKGYNPGYEVVPTACTVQQPCFHLTFGWALE
jgi:hypothetical protein